MYAGHCSPTDTKVTPLPQASIGPRRPKFLTVGYQGRLSSDRRSWALGRVRDPSSERGRRHYPCGRRAPGLS